MTEDKRTRIMASFTVCAILLIAFLAAVLIYQMVLLSSMRDRRTYLLTEIDRVTEQTSDMERDLNERLKSDWYLQSLLAEYLANNGN